MRTTRQMADYWTRRVTELEAMRPITAAEALAEAERLEASAAARDSRVAYAENVPMEDGYIGQGDTLAARGMRNNLRRGEARRAVWGETARALQDRGSAESLRRIAAQAEGTALAEALAEARQRRDYYVGLLARETQQA